MTFKLEYEAIYFILNKTKTKEKTNRQTNKQKQNKTVQLINKFSNTKQSLGPKYFNTWR